MAGGEGEEVDLEEIRPSVLVVLFAIATVGSAGSILLLAEFHPTPSGAVRSAFGQYIEWMGLAVVALVVAEGMDFLSRRLTVHSEIDVGDHTGRSSVFSIIFLSMMAVTLWNVGASVAGPIAVSIVPYPSPQFMVWKYATRFSLEVMLIVSAVVLILSVLVLVLRLIFDIITFGLDILQGRHKQDD